MTIVLKTVGCNRRVSSSLTSSAKFSNQQLRLLINWLLADCAQLLTSVMQHLLQSQPPGERTFEAKQLKMGTVGLVPLLKANRNILDVEYPCPLGERLRIKQGGVHAIDYAHLTEVKSSLFRIDVAAHVQLSDAQLKAVK